MKGLNVIALLFMGCEVGLSVNDSIKVEPSNDLDSEPSSFEPSSSAPTNEPGSTSQDNDADGYTVLDGDCNDNDPNVNPGAYDIPNDGSDQDCDGVDASTSSSGNDVDGDGYPSSVDCNDYNASIYPGAYDAPDDGIDQDCNGVDATASSGNDADGDGYTNTYDCNDYNASINPGAYDIPNNGIDEDCSGTDATSSSGGGSYYQGWETFKFADNQGYAGGYACDMSFSLSGTPSPTYCSSCTYTFDMLITYTGGIASADCTGLTTTASFSYGFATNYNGYGATLLMYDSYYGWQPWITNGTANFGRTDVVSISGSSFTYSVGYLDYFYNTGYYTYLWSGGGMAQ